MPSVLFKFGFELGCELGFGLEIADHCKSVRLSVAKTALGVGMGGLCCQHDMRARYLITRTVDFKPVDVGSNSTCLDHQPHRCSTPNGGTYTRIVHHHTASACQPCGQFHLLCHNITTKTQRSNYIPRGCLAIFGVQEHTITFSIWTDFTQILRENPVREGNTNTREACNWITHMLASNPALT
jgi:hypothetical protein